jgi:hypothetical protein
VDTVCITLDVDWASDEILGGALDLVASLGVPATVFCTHPTPALEGLDPRQFELAWHPNFLAGRDEVEVIDELARWFPGVVGVRSHALYFHSRLAPLYLDRGIEYVAHDLRFGQPGLGPSTHWSGLVDVPGFWEDDVHALFHDGDFDPTRVDLEADGLKVFDAHPIHLWLNTDRMARYEGAREDMEARRDLSTHVNPGLGARTFLIQAVEAMLALPDRYTFSTMRDVARAHACVHPYRGNYSTPH